MKDYELTIVLPGKFTPAKKKAVQERIEKLIKTFKGSVAFIISIQNYYSLYKAFNNKINPLITY